MNVTLPISPTQSSSFCFYCLKDFTKTSHCARCLFAQYCDKECQKKDWPSHKKVCQGICTYLGKIRKIFISHLSMPLLTTQKVVQGSGRISQILEEKFKQPVESSKTAIDLGCGPGASTLFLLENGWAVTAIDFDQESLDGVKNTAEERKISSKLTLVNTDISQSISLPKPADLVLVVDVLPYIDPLKLYKVLSHATTLMNSKGTLIGSFFLKDQIHDLPINHWYHTWWIESIESVQQLLSPLPAHEIKVLRTRIKQGGSSVVDFMIEFKN